MKLILTFLAGVSVAMSSEVSSQLVSGNNQFTAQMFHEVVKSNPGKSVILSAFSVLTPLAQLSLATDGASHDELLRSIGMPDDDTTKRVFSDFNKQVRSVEGVELKMASRVYVAQEYELNESFQAVSRDVFASDAKNVDFTKNTATAADINSWVESQTNNRIKDLVSPDSLNGDTRAVLVNAIYFKGKWEDQFKPENTRDRDFHVTKSNVVQLPTMYRKGKYFYGESKELDAKLLRLPYVGGQTSMLIILPNEIDGLAALEEKLKDPTAIAKATEQMNNVEVEVFLPKFKIETTTNLKDVLQKIGVKKIFEMGNAQLTKLIKHYTSDELYVSEAVQKAFIEVNEEGAEAAAANAFVVMTESLVIEPPSMIFRANHPFLLNIENGNTTLFTAVYHN